MLNQASVREVRCQEIPRSHALLILTMCYYPRGVRKDWHDGFSSELAPDRELFQDWKQYEKSFGHDAAFELSRYEERFTLSESALKKLGGYAELSHEKEIYFVCQCFRGERCHREMLLLLAMVRFGAKIAPLFHSYPRFERRISQPEPSVALVGASL